MRDSDLKRYFHKHKSLKIALETRNEEKRTNHSFKQTLPALTTNTHVNACKAGFASETFDSALKLNEIWINFCAFYAKSMRASTE